MPLDGTELGMFENQSLAKLGAFERLLASKEQWCKGNAGQWRPPLPARCDASRRRTASTGADYPASRQRGYWRVESFNNDPHTTHADVLRALRRARENVIAGMIEAGRHRPWHEKFAQAFRAALSGSVSEVGAALCFASGAPRPAGTEVGPVAQNPQLDENSAGEPRCLRFSVTPSERASMLAKPILSKPMLAAAAAAALLLPPPSPANAAVTGSAQQQAAPAVSGSSIELVPAWDLANRPLQDLQGHDAGQINGIVINTETGMIDFAVIGGRGNFNLNGNVIALPWAAVEAPIPARGPITIQVSAEKLAKAPELNPNALGNLEQQQARRDIYGYYGYPYWGRWGYGAAWGAYPGYGAWGPGYAGPGFAGPGGAYGPGYRNGPGKANANAPGNAGAYGSGPLGNAAAGNTGLNMAEQGQGQRNQTEPQLTPNGLFVSANGAISSLQSNNATSANAMRSAPVFISNYAGGGGAWNVGGPTTGSQVGNIRDVMIDPRHGQVAFVLIERGGFLGVQPRWYAVPPEALAWSPYQRGFDLTINDQLLNTAPPVQPANNNAPNAPIIVPVNQLAQLYRHFGVTPYWEQGSAGSNSGGTAGFAGANSGGSAAAAKRR